MSTQASEQLNTITEECRIGQTILADHYEAIDLGQKPTPPDPELLDEGIYDVSVFLWNSGFWIFTAGAGSRSNQSLMRLPYIRLRAALGASLDETRRQVTETLLQAGYRGFWSRSQCFHPTSHPAQCSPLDGFVEMDLSKLNSICDCRYGHTFAKIFKKSWTGNMTASTPTRRAGRANGRDRRRSER